MLYKIDRITDLAGHDRLDGRYPQRIGREGYIMPLVMGQPMAFVYAEPYAGTLVTTQISAFLPAPRGLKVWTKGGIYHFAEVEVGEDAWPEPVDWEEGP